MPLFAHVFRLHLWCPSLISCHVSNFACMWFKQGSFAIVLFGKMSDSFELVEGMEEFYFQADQVSIPGSDDSTGRAQHYVESYVYVPEEDVNAPGLGSHSEVIDAEVSTAQLPLTMSGCFITTSGKCLHTAVCHHGKRAEVKTLGVKICTKCLSNDIRRLPHTSEVYLDWNDCVHQSRVCEEFHRRHSHLSEIAVKRIVKKCRHCFWARISAGHMTGWKRRSSFAIFVVLKSEVCCIEWRTRYVNFDMFSCFLLKLVFGMVRAWGVFGTLCCNEWCWGRWFCGNSWWYEFGKWSWTSTIRICIVRWPLMLRQEDGWIHLGIPLMFGLRSTMTT